MSYQDATPELVRLPRVHIPTAPAVAAGAPLDELDIYRALNDELTRIFINRSNPVAVTEQDVARAALRKAAIIQQHLIVMYPNLLTPQRAVDLSQQVQQFQQDVQDQLQGVRQDIQHVRQDIQHVQVQLTEIAAEHQITNGKLKNTRAAGCNAHVVYDAVASRQPRHFYRFAKDTPRLGNGLPDVPAPVNPVPELQVGDVVPNYYFPESPSALRDWSHRQINNLSIILNNDFGIERADDLNERRHKLLEYLITG